MAQDRHIPITPEVRRNGLSRFAHAEPSAPVERLTVMPPSLTITQINAIMDRIEQPARNSDADSSR